MPKNVTNEQTITFARIQLHKNSKILERWCYVSGS